MTIRSRELTLARRGRLGPGAASHTATPVPYPRRVPEVLISFLDGEILHAEVGELAFDHPLLEAEVRGADPNNDRALFPLSGIRQLIVGTPEPIPEGVDVAAWDRAAFHFIDGQVLRASIAPDAALGRFGGTWRTVEPGGGEIQTLAIPYTALKGVFRLRHWDSRSAAARGGPDARIDHLARVLAERENQGAEPAANRRPLINRVRRRPRSD
jgi:hypothetical protein